MIIGIALRYYKTYQGRKYIPLTMGDKFCGLVGNNGVGKSSILEALDTFFNGRTWNVNKSSQKNKDRDVPEIMPIFAVKKSSIEQTNPLMSKFLFLDYLARNFVSDGQGLSKDFIKHRDEFFQYSSESDSYFIIPIGVQSDGQITFSFLSHYFEKNKNSFDGSDEIINVEDFIDVLKHFKEIIDYIYIPKEIDTETFTKLETKEIQVLMGESLNEALGNIVTEGQVKDINSQLNKFIDDISEDLNIYSYRTLNQQRQQNLKKADIYNLIVQHFFSIRRLHKKHRPEVNDSKWLDIGSLSSGEKQKAVIEVAYSLLNSRNIKGDKLVIAIDEPESSLHMSACYDQFDMLFKMSRECKQLIFATHWYGFLPTIELGNTTFITQKNGDHNFDLINLSNYREQIKQLTTSSRGQFPFDINLKSMNDFIQSIMSSITAEKSFNWIICEGSSEKNYLSAYFSDLIEDHRLRIVPVGGARYIKAIYQQLDSIFDDFKDEIKGKIFLLSDTDRDIIQYPIHNKERKNLQCKRLLLRENEIKLVHVDSTAVSPNTEIEHSLNGKLFYDTLLTYKENYSEMLSFLELGVDIDDCVVSGNALDLKKSEQKRLEDFFDVEGIKYEFSTRYCEILDGNKNLIVPSWIEEIRGYFEGV
ncbi:hypothetical protein AAX09_06975 [Moraxella bovoculi]|uniref:AAA family ATPase n=1 Tax=Moraxella bovoculi TaxID=386891 RepID=UPI000624A7ED|nr:AAA family ATPase [Moraxella bovoculi]AKG19813.1 hypothetical protein AAX09_06975 [Moraxella bovoculi]